VAPTQNLLNEHIIYSYKAFPCLPSEASATIESLDIPGRTAALLLVITLRKTLHGVRGNWTARRPQGLDTVD